MSRLGKLLGVIPDLKDVLGIGEKFTEKVIAPAANALTKTVSGTAKVGEKVIQEGGKFLAEQPGVFGYSQPFANKFGVKPEDTGGAKNKRMIDLNIKKINGEKLTQNEEDDLKELNKRAALRWGFMTGGLQEVASADQILKEAVTGTWTSDLVKDVATKNGGKLPKDFIQGRIDDISNHLSNKIYNSSNNLEGNPVSDIVKPALAPLLNKSYSNLEQFSDDVLNIFSRIDLPGIEKALSVVNVISKEALTKLGGGL